MPSFRVDHHPPTLVLMLWLIAGLGPAAQFEPFALYVSLCILCPAVNLFHFLVTAAPEACFTHAGGVCCVRLSLCY